MGPCTGWTPPSKEICGDALDSDCDGSEDCAECATTGECSGGDGNSGGSNGGDGDTGGSNGGDGDTGGSNGGDGCVCNPGTVRWCDTPIACAWGQQVCAPDMTWGACTETMSRPAGCQGSFFYDEDCCDAAANACCQSLIDDSSFGECTQQLDCN